MIAHRTILKNAALAVAADAGILAYCVEHFGRGLAINVGAYPNGVPEAKDSPWLWIRPKEENDAVNADQTFTACFTVGGCVLGPSGEKVVINELTPRTKEANGVTVNGGNLIVEDLRDMIVAVLRDSMLGAPIVAVRRTENDISHFPLEWAEFFIDFFEPADLA